MRKATVVLTGVLLVVGGAGWVFGGTRTNDEAHAQSNLAPRECVCSAGLPLGGVAGGSLLRNCQCAALQCVVVTGSGQLQCR